MQRNIILIGFMGTGKSTIGRNLSRTFGYPLIDTDQMIEEQQGRPIPDIFATDGEDVFRDIETEVLRSLHKPSGHIIATGPPEAITQEKGSYTGHFLSTVLENSESGSGHSD